MDICHSPESGTPGAPLRPKSSAPRSGFVQPSGSSEPESGVSVWSWSYRHLGVVAGRSPATLAITEPMPLSFLICIIGFCVLQCSAWLVYGIWIPRFVERHGGRTAGIATHLFLGWGWLQDYRAAHALRRQFHSAPWFLRLFEILEVLALLFFLGGIGSAIWAH